MADIVIVADVATAPLHPTVPAWVWSLGIAACMVATFTDLRNMRIPNWLTLPLLAAGLVYGGTRGGWDGLANAGLGCAVAGAIFVAAYAIAGGGAGDAKLMMALGAWVGLYPSVVLVLAVTICGAICAIAVTIFRDGLSAVPVLLMHSVLWTRFLGLRFVRSALTGSMLTKKSVRDERIDEAPKPRTKGWFPYAPSILAGTAVAWWYWQSYGSVI
jgi:Flp pilus assembly protein protease CpaA